MVSKSLFITFEGADGSGKSTQLEKIAEYLKQRNIDCIQTLNPGGTRLGKKIREILLNYDGNVSSYCELFLYLADRAQHINEVVLPALDTGKIVLCDRYTDSTVAYQGYARGLDIEELTNLNNVATNSTEPDLTLLFDVDTSVAMTRVGDSKDRMESEAEGFHKKVRNGYLELAKKYPDRIKIINANNSIEKVFEDAVKVIEQCLKG